MLRRSDGSEPRPKARTLMGATITGEHERQQYSNIGDGFVLWWAGHGREHNLPVRQDATMPANDRSCSLAGREMSPGVSFICPVERAHLTASPMA